jgi:arabinogalactan endo-1,4-beta-galactosidase
MPWARQSLLDGFKKMPSRFDVLVLFFGTVWEQNINNSSKNLKSCYSFQRLMKRLPQFN